MQERNRKEYPRWKEIIVHVNISHAIKEERKAEGKEKSVVK